MRAARASAALAALSWAGLAALLVWWAGENPLPDGFQNEYLHVGNAYDLWGALRDGDVFHLRWYMYTGYWPWGFYAVPWPFLAVLGTSRLALLLGNLVHLGVLLAAMVRLGRVFGAPLAPVLVALCPGVFGSLLRFEPNLATVAWTAAGVAALVESQGLRVRSRAVAWGACLGLGLMFDRLTVGFFLVPAVLPLLWAADRRAWTNLAAGAGTALFLTAAYYREFFLRHTDELLGQAPVGEIDSAGHLLTTGAIVPGSYYLLGLVDSQAGPVLGGLMLWGLVLSVRAAWPRSGGPKGPRQSHQVLLAAVLPAALFFTLVAKKQLFYTLPVLGPLALMAATRGRFALLGVAGGLWCLAAGALGVVPRGLPATPWLPPGWVVPRHTLTKPPSHQRWPFSELKAAIEKHPHQDILVMSQDPLLFDGYLTLALREQFPDSTLRSVLGDPTGTYECLRDQDVFIWAGEPGGGWPAQGTVEAELIRDHYALDDLPPVARELAAVEGSYARLPGLHLTGGPRDDPDTRVELVVYLRQAPKPEAPCRAGAAPPAEATPSAAQGGRSPTDRGAPAVESAPPRERDP